MNNNNAINKDFFDISADIDTVIKDIEKRHFIRQDLINAKYKWAEYLKKYLYLTYVKDIAEKIPIEKLYINRFFWFKLFYHYYKKDCGIDVGIEQQIGQLIENMCNDIKDTNFDWNILEEIHNDIINENYIDILNKI
ncbi:hypothetical protein FACS189426_12510 [Bacteroidia bacterium]|nr:hypothetical protein FACS189426_12510 [Bacteroidia bacterium]